MGHAELREGTVDKEKTRLIDRDDMLSNVMSTFNSLRRQEQERLAKAGHTFRVLISYGEAWFPWYMRRLAERPANVLFVARNLFAR